MMGKRVLAIDFNVVVAWGGGATIQRLEERVLEKTGLKRRHFACGGYGLIRLLY